MPVVFGRSQLWGGKFNGIGDLFILGGKDIKYIIPIMVQCMSDIKKFCGIVSPRSVVVGVIFDAEKAFQNS